jgi:hypothetical protein
MATLNEAMAHIKANYVYEETDSLLKLEFTTEGKRSQVVWAAGTDDLLFVFSPFAVGTNPEIVLNLTENAFYGIGRTDGGVYVVRHFLPLADVDASEIDLALKLVASQADALESQIGGDRF